MIYTVFFDTQEMPQDFETHLEAEKYAEEKVKSGFANSYVIEATDGSVE